MTVAIAGARSAIAVAFRDRLGSLDEVVTAKVDKLPLNAHRYLICTGYLAGKAIDEISGEELRRTWELNFFLVVRACEAIFDANDYARIVVMGSESGISGSYDRAYAGAKAALHRYVETKKLRTADQMLVALAPHIIRDTAMTERRNDLRELDARAAENRLGRWLTSREVAAEIDHLLFRASTSLSGQVIRMRAI